MRLNSSSSEYYILFFESIRDNQRSSFRAISSEVERSIDIMEARKPLYYWPKNGKLYLIFKMAKSLIHLTITGGEPFVRKDFFEIIDNIILSCDVLKISTKTNGFYTDRIKDFAPKLINKHKNVEFTLSISLDALERVHNTVRNFKGAYQKVLETIDAMKAYKNQPNFFLRLASVLTKDNRYFLEDLLNKTSLSI